MNGPDTLSTSARILLFIAAVFAQILLAGTISASEAGSEQIAVLVSNSGNPYEEMLAGFEEYLARQGIQADHEVYQLEGDASRAMEAVQKIRKNRAKVILAIGSLAADSALKEISDVPVVAGMVLKSDAYKKAGNATGIVLEFPVETQFKRIQHFLPSARNIGVIYNPSENRERVEAAGAVARKMGFTLEVQEINRPQDLPAALESLSRRADALWGIADTVVLTPQTAKHILLFSFRNRIPFIGLSEAWVKAGALYSLDWDYADLGAQCGEMVLKVLRGSRPNSIPWASPRKVLYSVNLNTARQMKIRIPYDSIAGANKVF